MSTDTPDNPNPYPNLRPKNRSLNGRVASLQSWANTKDRRQRLATAHANSPVDIAWHAKKMGFDPDAMTEGEYLQAEAARKAYFARLNRKSVQVRQAKAAARKAAREAARETNGGTR
ncbi:hypothetical protein MYCO108962_24390 [Mycobacterium colombiense]|uniref:hypothetical protein n=1 Tax=Mycobacterium colombiense TaxID=339268 RepID=UPI00021B1D1B|nr:hypothetical protein [Mycobacterium colombiense]